MFGAFPVSRLEHQVQLSRMMGAHCLVSVTPLNPIGLFTHLGNKIDLSIKMLQLTHMVGLKFLIIVDPVPLFSIIQPLCMYVFGHSM